eukprot:6217415-Karenia_brevis.AAC.1
MDTPQKVLCHMLLTPCKLQGLCRQKGFVTCGMFIWKGCTGRLKYLSIDIMQMSRWFNIIRWH